MALTFTLTQNPSVPLEAEALCPDRVVGLNETQIAALTVMHGNEKASVGDFFKVSGRPNGELRVEGDLSRVKLIGANMTQGRVVVLGNVGLHLGAGMSGGEILVEGNASDWVAPDMVGGRITIKGNAGHMVGSCYRGARTGMRGGEIIVHGKVGNEAGNGMRRGLIAVGGNSGDFTGVSMLAGTVIVLGEMGIRAGASMKRGTIVSMRPAEVLPTFSYAGTLSPQFLGLYLTHLQGLGLPVTDAHFQGPYKQWRGDSLELNRGELLLLAD